LGDTDNVESLKDRRDGKLLDGGGTLVAGELYVLNHYRMKAGVLEGVDILNLNRTFLAHIDLREPCFVSTVSWRNLLRRNLLAEVKTSTDFALLKRAEEFFLELGDLGADITILIIPLIDAGAAIESTFARATIHGGIVENLLLNPARNVCKGWLGSSAIAIGILAVDLLAIGVLTKAAAIVHRRTSEQVEVGHADF
jgi:hypothetical protein